MRALVLLGLAAALLAGLSARPAVAEEGRFHVKPSALAPAGPPGETSRTIRSFGTWTLVCDENLKQRQRVCNIFQEIADETGQVVFSWSLAGTRGGAPMMIVRAPSTGTGTRSVELAFSGGPGTPLPLERCAGPICLGILQVTKAIGRSLRQDDHAVATLMVDGRLRTIDLPLRDLNTALTALDEPRARPKDRPVPPAPAPAKSAERRGL